MRRAVRNEAGTPRCGRERIGCLPRNGSLPRVIFSAFTDHRVTRKPIRSEPTLSPRDLKPWKPLDGPIGRRNLRIAPIQPAQSESPADDTDLGVALLQSALSARARDPSVLEALGTGLFLSGNPQRVCDCFGMPFAQILTVPCTATPWRRLGGTWAPKGCRSGRPNALSDSSRDPRRAGSQRGPVRSDIHPYTRFQPRHRHDPATEGVANGKPAAVSSLPIKLPGMKPIRDGDSIGPAR